MKAKLMSTLSPFGGGQGEERYKTKDKNMQCNQIKITTRNFNVIRTIEYEIDKILPLPPPEGDKLLGNDNE